MPTNRYETLITLVRTKLNLTSSDISDANALILLNDVLREFSRLAGVIYTQEITYSAGTSVYDVTNAAADFVVDAFWNDTYPDDTLIDELNELTKEEGYWNSLRIIEALRECQKRRLLDKRVQRWWAYENSATDLHTTKLKVDPSPTTNIWIFCRTLYTTDNYPKSQEHIIEKGLTASFLEYLMGSAQVESEGSVRFNNSGMAERARRLRADFYLACSPYTAGA